MFTTGTKETLCTSCSHSAVCSYKETFLKLQKSVDGISYDIGVGVGENTVQYISDMDWVNVTIHCRHHILKYGREKSDVATRTNAK